MRRFLILGLVALVLGTIYALVLWRTQRRVDAGGDDGSTLSAPADSPAAFRAVAPFTLQDSAGRTVTRDSLLGRPWIAGFVFTRCTGPCPRVTAHMVKAQDLLKGDDVRLVTFSVDPEYDTPAVLAEYAAKAGADTQRWTFLTGTEAAIGDLSRESFMLPIEKTAGQPPGESIVHRTNLTVVDSKGVVRGYYDGETLEGVQQAVARARYLAQHRDAAGPAPR